MANPVSDALAASLSATPRPFPAILVGGLIVGVLDLTYAILVYSPQKPIRVPQTIASGLLGVSGFASKSASPHHILDRTSPH